MENEKNEDFNSQDEDLDNGQEKNIDDDLDLEDEEGDDEELDAEELKSKLSALKDKNKKLFERAKKAEEKFKKIKEVEPDKAPSAAPKTEDISITAVLDLQAKGFTPQEIKGLNEEAKTMGIPIDTLISNENYMAGVEAKRAKQKAEEATPRPSSSNPIKLSGGKTFREVVSDEEATKEDKQKAFEETRDKIIGK